MERLNGKVAVVTGGNSGIGLAAARAFVREGGRVAVFGRNAETVKSTVTELRGAGATLSEAALGASDGNGGIAVATETVIGVRGDVTNGEDLDRLFGEVRERLGGVDVLFVNAGIAVPAPFDQTSEELFDQHFDVNVKGAYFTVQKALPLLNDGASVILTTSAGNQMGMPNMSAYLATKAALRSMARTLSSELVGRGIRVNAISPGPIETPIFGRLGMPQEQMDQFAEQITGMIPAGRFGQATEIAEAVVFLASPESSYVLGAEFVVDGGMSQL
jgi:NAD(P)-dependent dehydrogenase (short-subunit alcohol dehydrogenase family)